MTKSIKLVITDEAGMISRGKYTLLIKLAFEIKLELDSDRLLAKNCQGSIAA